MDDEVKQTGTFVLKNFQKEIQQSSLGNVVLNGQTFIMSKMMHQGVEANRVTLRFQVLETSCPATEIERRIKFAHSRICCTLIAHMTLECHHEYKNNEMSNAMVKVRCRMQKLWFI